MLRKLKARDGATINGEIQCHIDVTGFKPTTISTFQGGVVEVSLVLGQASLPSYYCTVPKAYNTCE